MSTQTFQLNPAEVAALQTPINGQGGLQSFGRALQRALNPVTGSITLSDAQVGRIIRHLGYGPGGFEGRLRTAFGRSILQALAQA
ncbi:hypothetical protein [Sphingobium sp. CAP-1]|uniref:hypothetical protein n=1 Tax=Sphingobium sp. CAP-1 TaxID=2676077 RepID=UPI0012BB28E3|nr:hypothetical protein [Sphingobium sp. CAP-1]QGP78814.1 hypothetical protein GL174_07280 [Sphingobium sp. CAP-1]